jgi:hypothetical protein
MLEDHWAAASAFRTSNKKETTHHKRAATVCSREITTKKTGRMDGWMDRKG